MKTAAWTRFYPPAVPLRRTAAAVPFHEAGHVVLAKAVGLGVESAAVHGDGSGFVRYASTSSDASPPPASSARLHSESMLLRAAMAFAGWQSEYLHAGVDPSGILRRDDQDHLLAGAVIAETFVNTDLAALHAQRLARRVLLHAWPTVERIAELLDRHGQLTAAEIDAACIEKLPGHDFMLKPIPHAVYDNLIEGATHG